MGAESPFAAVTAAIGKIVKMETAVMKKRHAIADGGVPAARLPVLPDLISRAEDLQFALCNLLRATVQVVRPLHR